jgi:hypothetical protein
MIKSLTNDTDAEINVNGLVFPPGASIRLARIPEINESATFGRVLTYMGADELLGLDDRGEIMPTDTAIFELNEIKSQASSVTPFTREELIQLIRDEIDAKTDGIIATGFTYADLIFPSTIEHQMNYKTIYDLRDTLPYPFTVKGKGQNFHAIQDAAEMGAFFWTAFTFVHTTLTDGWGVKGSLDALTADQLLTFEDPR